MVQFYECKVEQNVFFPKLLWLVILYIAEGDKNDCGGMFKNLTHALKITAVYRGHLLFST